MFSFFFFLFYNLLILAVLCLRTNLRADLGGFVKKTSLPEFMLHVSRLRCSHFSKKVIYLFSYICFVLILRFSQTSAALAVDIPREEDSVEAHKSVRGNWPL